MTHPAIARRVRHEKYRASGDPLTVTRHGRPIGHIAWNPERSTWGAWLLNPDPMTASQIGEHGDPVKAEMLLVKNATLRA